MKIIKRTIPVNQVVVHLPDGGTRYCYIPVGEPVTDEYINKFLPSGADIGAHYELLHTATYETFTLSEGEFIRNSILEKEKRS